MSYKSYLIETALTVAGWFLSISDFFVSFASRQRNHILATIFENKLSSFIIINNNKVYDMWNCEKYNLIHLFYIYVKYHLDYLYLPSLKVPVHPNNFYALTSYKDGQKIYHVSNNLDEIYDEHKDIVYAILDDHDITHLIRGMYAQLPVDMIRNIARHMFHDIKGDAEQVLKIMKDNTFTEIIFKGTEEVII